jgi:uncharacterized protein YjbJ (UPF0337 family)
MDEDRIDGAVRNAAGHAKDAAGGLTGDASLQAEGKVDEALGNLQQRYGQAASVARDTAGDVRTIVRGQPMTALLVAGGIGFLIGLLRG